MHATQERPVGIAMPILTIRHITAYRYRRPVAFGEHRMMLRPRDDDDQKVLDSGTRVTPAPTELVWTQDAFGNHVAIARFTHSASELRFESRISVEHAPAGFHAAGIADYARTYPFGYAAGDRAELARFIAQVPPPPQIARWAAGFLRADGTADTYALL